jgi:UDP-3-O-[3-hydroxymyristoyl] glucosamine N-acyltransferase
MEFTAATIAGFLKGEVEGDPETIVNNIAKIEEGHKGALSFLANPKYEHYIYTTESSIVLVNKSFVPSSEIKATLIRVENAYEAFASLLRLVDQARPRKKGIHSSAVIEPSAKVGSDVYIGPFAYVGENCVIGDNSAVYPHSYIGDNTKIGRNCILYSGVKIYHDCVVGEGCTVHAGTVIGSDGFGFAPQSETEFMKIPQIGNVVIEDHVAIDRATMGSTIIRKGVKLDNLIQIGHNVEVGENTVMAGQTGIAGSTKIGKNCMFAGQVGIAGHLKIADGTKIGAQAGIPGDVKNENSILLGYPAIDHLNFLRSSVIFRKLPELKTKVDALEKQVETLINR